MIVSEFVCRFHLLSEFDNGKRSCRKRLADHNRRRRKTHQQPNPESLIKSQPENPHNSTPDNLTSKPLKRHKHNQVIILISRLLVLLHTCRKHMVIQLKRMLFHFCCFSSASIVPLLLIIVKHLSEAWKNQEKKKVIWLVGSWFSGFFFWFYRPVTARLRSSLIVVGDSGLVPTTNVVGLLQAETISSYGFFGSIKLTFFLKWMTLSNAIRGLL